jgi:hypothetical protein
MGYDTSMSMMLVFLRLPAGATGIKQLPTEQSRKEREFTCSSRSVRMMSQ